MRFRTFVICVSGGFLGACQTFSPAPWPWTSSNVAVPVPTCTADACTESDARAALAVASKYCYDVMNKQGMKGAAIGGSKLAIGTIGAVSGSVIAQFAQGAAAQAWSGVSGVANGMQTQIDQSFANAIDIRRREHIAQAAFEGAALVHDATTPADKIERSMQMALGCSMNAATADATILKLLSGGEDTKKATPAVDSHDLQGQALTVRHRFEGPGGQALAEAQAKDYAATVCKAREASFVAKVQDTAVAHCAGTDCELEAKFECGP